MSSITHPAIVAAPAGGDRLSPLLAAHDHIDVERVELDPATDAAGLVGGDEGRAGAEERVDDDIAAMVRSSTASSSMAVGLTIGWPCRTLLGIARPSALHYGTGGTRESLPYSPTIAGSASSRDVDEIHKSPNPGALGDTTLSNCMSST
jgi:hypothetical protein